MLTPRLPLLLTWLAICLPSASAGGGIIQYEFWGALPAAYGGDPYYAKFSFDAATPDLHPDQPYARYEGAAVFLSLGSRTLQATGRLHVTPAAQHSLHFVDDTNGVYLGVDIYLETIPALTSDALPPSISASSASYATWMMSRWRWSAPIDQIVVTIPEPPALSLLLFGIPAIATRRRRNLPGGPCRPQ